MSSGGRGRGWHATVVVGPVLLAVATVVVAASCGPSAAVPAAGAVVRVVAVENFWGSIASQVGGGYVAVTSIIANPDVDPHSYEPTAADARAIAAADLVIVNGVGYDGWVRALLAADGGGRHVLDVGAVVGAASGANPHRWYDPADVRTVVGAYAAALGRIDPRHAAAFEAQAGGFDAVGLRDYDAAIASIRRKYGGTAVGASESIFSMLAPALGLDVVTPISFLRAVSEGTDVSAADKALIDGQIAHRRLRIYVYNGQNATPDVQAQLAECRRAGIPTVTITETLTPPSTTFQAWQTDQLDRIEAALAAATGR